MTTLPQLKQSKKSKKAYVAKCPDCAFAVVVRQTKGGYAIDCPDYLAEPVVAGATLQDAANTNFHFQLKHSERHISTNK